MIRYANRSAESFFGNMCWETFPIASVKRDLITFPRSIFDTGFDGPFPDPSCVSSDIYN